MGFVDDSSSGDAEIGGYVNGMVVQSYRNNCIGIRGRGEAQEYLPPDLRSLLGSFSEIVAVATELEECAPTASLDRRAMNVAVRITAKPMTSRVKS